MKSELLISAAMIPMWGMAGEAIAASPEKGVPKEKQRPNIVLFLVDDMGWQDTSLPFWTQRTHYNTRQDVHTSVCLQYQFPYPCQPFHRNECSPPSRNQLDIT